MGEGEKPVEGRRQAVTLLRENLKLRPHPFLPEYDSSYLPKEKS